MPENNPKLSLCSYYKLNKKRFYIYAISSILIVTVISIFLRTYFMNNYYLALNFTPSLTERIFILDKHSNIDNLKKDDIVGFRYMDDDYPFYKKGESFIKYIACMEGDELVIENNQVSCNGKYLGSQIKQDSKGNILPQFSFNGKIPKDKFFMWTPFVKSYDSRYWGFVDRNDILGKSIWKY